MSKNRTVIRALLITIFFPVLALAQELQWLQYHSARMARDIVGDMGSQSVGLSPATPAGVELPEFKGSDPLFGKWSSPLAPNGSLWLALDRSQQGRPHDLLFIDSDGDGHLKNETAITAYQVDQYYARFEPAKVVLQIEGEPVSYHLNFENYHRDNRNSLRVSSGCWYEGKIKVGQQEKHCVIIDQNTNGTFNDKSINAYESDRIRIGRQTYRDTRYVGNYINIDGKFYLLEIARDGAYIKLTIAEDLKFGTVNMPENITEFIAGGENGLLTVKPEKGVGKLPVGKYRIDRWVIERKDDKGSNWKLQGRGFGDNGNFDVTEASVTTMNVGEPIVSVLTARKDAERYIFGHNLQGQLGERIELTRNGGRSSAPKLQIKNKDGTYDRTFTFEYG